MLGLAVAGAPGVIECQLHNSSPHMSRYVYRTGDQPFPNFSSKAGVLFYLTAAGVPADWKTISYFENRLSLLCWGRSSDHTSGETQV